MAKRTQRPTPPTATAEAIEDRVIAFAEQLGWLVGRTQATAEGWMDRDALARRLSSIRDGATQLLQQLAGGDEPSAQKKRAATGRKQARSGGVVDAPGKTHRKAPPRDPDARRARSQASKVRTALPKEKTKRRGARG